MRGMPCNLNSQQFPPPATVIMNPTSNPPRLKSSNHFNRMAAPTSLIKNTNRLDVSEFETTGTIPNGPTSLLWNQLAQTIKENNLHVSSDFVALLISQCSHDRLHKFVKAIGITDEDIDDGDTTAICNALQDASSVAQVGILQCKKS